MLNCILFNLSPWRQKKQLFRSEFAMWMESASKNVIPSTFSQSFTFFFPSLLCDIFHMYLSYTEYKEGPTLSGPSTLFLWPTSVEWFVIFVVWFLDTKIFKYEWGYTKCVCVPVPTHCTIMCFGFHARWIDGVDFGLFSNHAPLGQTTLRVGWVSV